MSYLLLSMLPWLFALGLGPLIAWKTAPREGRIILRAGQGLLILFAMSYLFKAMSDTHYARTFWPDTPWQHSLGPDWPNEMFWKAIGEMSVTGCLFLVSFAVTLFVRKVRVEEAKRRYLEGKG